MKIHIVMENMGFCRKCGKWEDLRGGCCFDCVFEPCPREECPFRKLVFNAQREMVWKDMTYIGKNGKKYCDRIYEGLCSDGEYEVARKALLKTKFGDVEKLAAPPGKGIGKVK